MSFERVVDEYASRQHGVVTRAQLLSAGVPVGVVERRLTAGRLKGLHRGVYIAGPVIPPPARELAACLACGAGAVVSHRSAGALWGMVAQGAGGGVDVSVCSRSPCRPGITVHRPRFLEPDERTELDGVPLTTPARTIADLAPAISAKLLERVVSDALAARLVTPDGLLELAVRYAGRPGARRLAEVLGTEGPRFTRSEAESRFLSVVRHARLPAPLVNRVVAGHEVDFVWVGARLVVEVDGFAYHASRRSFEHDRTRDSDLARAGLRVVRVTWAQLVDHPLSVAALLGGLLMGASEDAI